MPKIPVYQQQTNGVSAFPNARRNVPAATPAAMGGVEAQKFQQLSELATRQAQLLQEQEDRDLVNQAQVLLEQEQNNYLNDPTSGAFQRRGTAAFGVAKDTAQWFEDNRDNFQKGLRTDRQKRLFEEQFQALRSNAVRAVSRFEQQERRASFVASTQARAASAVEQAALFYTQPEIVQAGYENALKAVDDLADIQGMTDEERTQLRLNATSQFHRKQIEARLEANPKEAKAWLSQNADEMTADDRELLKGRLKTADLRAQSQQAADKIMGRGMDEAQALEAARRLSPEIRDEVVARVKSRYADSRRIMKQDAEDAMRDAYNMWLEGTPVHEIPEDIYSRLEPESKAALKALEDKENVVVTDQATWYALQRLATDPASRGKFEEMNLLNYADRLDKGDMEYFAKMQSDLKKGDTKGIEALATKEQMIDAALLRLGLDPADDGKKGKSDSKKILAFREQLEREYREYQEVNGKKPDGKTLDEMLNRLSIKVVREKNWWPDSEIGQFEITPEELGDVPQDMVDDLAAAISSTGEAVTIEKIRALWKEVGSNVQ